MTKATSRQRLLGAVAILAFVTACTAHPPSRTEIPVSVPGHRTDIVSVCYDSGDHSRAEIEAVALAICPENTAQITAWRVDRVLNECPLLKKSRVSFICAPARLGYGQ
ncbi:MAG: hypothetical protein WD767_17575 [Alphaproteobacteria bacterium]